MSRILWFSAGIVLSAVSFRITEKHWQADVLAQHQKALDALAKKDADNCLLTR
jgi:DNA-binding GntR family transcriptional regulator